MSTEEDVEINVTMRPRGFEETRKGIGDVSGEADRASMSYRALSRDFMMTARSINIINREFLGNNAVVKDMVGILYGLTAALRLVTVAEHLMGSATLANVAKHLAEAGAIWTKVAAMIAAAAVNPLTWGLLAGAVAVGVGTYAAMKGGMKSMQLGGVVTQTGPHLLHKGEIVTNPSLGKNVLNIAGVVASITPSQRTEMRSMQTGGVATQTGLHLLHAGEIITNSRLAIHALSDLGSTGRVATGEAIKNIWGGGATAQTGPNLLRKEEIVVNPRLKYPFPDLSVRHNLEILKAGAVRDVGTIKSMQRGGIATYTGPHLLHAGEVVTSPKIGQGITGHTFVNIDMKTGPISSKIDVEDMLVDMGSEVAKATRRRTGHG